VRVSEQPVIIAGIDGGILLMNNAFRTLLPREHMAARLDDLAAAFQQPKYFLESVRELVDHHRAWRGELLLRDEGNREKPLMVRADPVQPSRDRVLGFVLIFSDITDRKAAEVARSRFQEGILKSNRINKVRLDSKTDLVHQNLLSAVVENAQLAALEITYGAETGRIADMLESVRNSTLRTAELLEHLIWHSSRTSGDNSKK
ncbi:PAS domain-containing protein, partial [Bradyrhizobium sp.]|uniref:PAS domain-containing protein n=1 Tax=Bradyrhizobium sp. TaxID=376 RepID=UPI003C61479D